MLLSSVTHKIYFFLSQTQRSPTHGFYVQILTYSHGKSLRATRWLSLVQRYTIKSRFSSPSTAHRSDIPMWISVSVAHEYYVLLAFHSIRMDVPKQIITEWEKYVIFLHFDLPCMLFTYAQHFDGNEMDFRTLLLDIFAYLLRQYFTIKPVPKCLSHMK